MKSISKSPNQIVGTFEHSSIDELMVMVHKWAHKYFEVETDAQITYEFEPTEFYFDMTLSGDEVSRRATTRVHASRSTW